MICPLCHAPNDENATSCASCGVSLAAPADDNGHALPRGATLRDGQFVLASVLGQGGFGITYAARDEALGRVVAIKEFFPQGGARRDSVVTGGAMTSEEFGAAREKFSVEARVLARFSHPHIVDVYDVFEQNATAYMVMEWLRGQTLGALIEARGALPESEVLTLVQTIAGALHAVHEGGLLHRDIKPDNIIVTDQGRAVLIDFGSARDFASRQSRTHSIVLTPGYAPLEQYATKAKRGPFSDVYALAATLYHALSGEMPASATDRAAGVELTDLRELRPDLSARVASAVMGAMAMEIAARPPSARDFALRLSAQHDEQVSGKARCIPESDDWRATVWPRHALRPAFTAALERLVLRGHQGKIEDIVWSPDGALLASAAHDKTIRLWSGRTGDLRAVLKGHLNRVTCVAFSPEGAFLASGSHDGRLHLWDTRAGNIVRSLDWPMMKVLLGHEGWITSLAFSRHGPLIVTGSDSYSGHGEVTLWDSRAGTMLKTLRGHNRRVNCVAWSPDDARVVAGNADGSVKVWDAQSGELRLSLQEQDAPIESVAWSPDGAILAIGGARMPLQLHSAKTGHKQHSLQGPSSGIVAIAFSPDESTLATASGRFDETVRLWNVQSGELEHTLNGHSDGVTCLAWSPDGASLATGSDDRTVRIWRR